jgi:hypothetical protein
MGNGDFAGPVGRMQGVCFIHQWNIYTAIVAKALPIFVTPTKVLPTSVWCCTSFVNLGDPDFQNRLFSIV